MRNCRGTSTEVHDIIAPPLLRGERDRGADSSVRRYYRSCQQDSHSLQSVLGNASTPAGADVRK